MIYQVHQQDAELRGEERGEQKEKINNAKGMLHEGLSADFISMDGRFLSDKTAYGSSSADKPTGDNTVCLYLGYYTDRAESVFGRHMKVFGANPDLEL